MKFKFNYATPLLAAGATAVAILVAPTASAAPPPLTKTCSESGGTITCQSPGNVEIHTHTSRPSIGSDPFENWPLRIGDRNHHRNHQRHGHHHGGHNNG